HGDGVRLGRGSGSRRNESAGLNDSVKRTAIDHQVLDHRKGLCPERLDRNLFAVVKFSHVKLASCSWMIGAVRFAIDCKRTRAANPLAAIGVESDRFLTAQKEPFVHNIE